MNPPVPDYAFDFDDADPDRHDALLERLAGSLPIMGAYLDDFSHELVIVAVDFEAAVRRAERIVRDATHNAPELYLPPLGRN